MNINDKYKKIESILFIKGSLPTSTKELSSILDMSVEKITPFMNEYIEMLNKDESRSLTIKAFDDSYKMVTKPEMKNVIKDFVKIKFNNDIKLTQPMLEVLTIVAYAQPITRVEIDYIRGVESNSTIQKLMAVDLIEQGERAQKVGSPWLYKTTKYFLEHFNKKELNNLPEFNDYINNKQLEFEIIENSNK
ncbi:MAG: SMC-Scp complex subunit ScpB [Mycoplasmataceae bacterium]|nr:SMC-Scp complex subunit ScpB [Mycoplasmataceae bacterium]